MFRIDGHLAKERYRRLSARYDYATRRIEPVRRRAIDALRLERGQRVLDVACGTGKSLEMLREAVGPEIDLILECHGRYDPEWAIELAKRAEPYHPFLIEDPIRHENPAALAYVRAHTSIPLATGERYHSKWEFRELIVNQWVNYLRPDVCHCGGISEMCKIAAMGEAFYQSLILHNNAGPLGTAASLHASNASLAAIPNVKLLEAP